MTLTFELALDNATVNQHAQTDRFRTPHTRTDAHTHSRPIALLGPLNRYRTQSQLGPNAKPSPEAPYGSMPMGGLDQSTSQWLGTSLTRSGLLPSPSQRAHLQESTQGVI